MEKQYQIIKPKHGYFRGGVLEADISPMIDTGVGCWHTLIGESMEDIKCEPVAYDEQNGYLRQDGCVGTLTTDGSSPKHNNRIVEPRICAMRGRNPDNPSDRTAGSPTQQRIEIGSEETSNTLTTVQKDNLVVEPTYRIRKLTERECFRLMGVRVEDFEKVSKNQSTSSLYHLAGDALVTTVLMAILGELFAICDYGDKINNLIDELKEDDK